MMKLGTVIAYWNRSKKYMKHVKHHLSSADVSNLLPEIRKFCYIIKKKMYRLHFDTKFQFLLNFLGSLKIALIKKVRILMMSGKMATPELLKIKVFWKNGYDVIVYVHDVTNKILSCNSNYAVDVAMRLNFCNSSISLREVIVISIL